MPPEFFTAALMWKAAVSEKKPRPQARNCFMSRAKKKAAHTATITKVTMVGKEVSSRKAAPMQVTTRSMLFCSASRISWLCSSRKSRSNWERNSPARLRKSVTGWENSAKPFWAALVRKAVISRTASTPKRASPPQRTTKAKMVAASVAGPWGSFSRFCRKPITGCTAKAMRNPAKKGRV